MTKLVLAHARAVLPGDIDIVAVTAGFGAEVIASETAFAIAAHATLDAYAAQPGPWDAVLLACFGDPGLYALREISPAPVVAFADAAMREAARHGRFAIVTGGDRWAPMLTRLAATLGHADALAGVVTLPANGAQIAADPDAAIGALRDAVTEAVARYGAQAVIVGGAGLAGLAARLQPDAPVPLIDSVLAGARRAGALAHEHASARAAQLTQEPVPPDRVTTTGLTQHLKKLLG